MTQKRNADNTNNKNNLKEKMTFRSAGLAF